MTFVCKQIAVSVVCINTIGQKESCFNRLFAIFLTLYFLPFTSVGLTSCISIVVSVLFKWTRMTAMLRVVSV